MMMSRYVEKKAMFREKLAENNSSGIVRSNGALSQSQHGTQELNDETIYEYCPGSAFKEKGPRSKSGNIPWVKPHV